jgi:hypothetical protein
MRGDGREQVGWYYHRYTEEGQALQNCTADRTHFMGCVSDVLTVERKDGGGEGSRGALESGAAIAAEISCCRSTVD